MNPLWQASQVLTLRRTALGVKPTGAADSKSENRQRQASSVVRQKIRLLQEQFWTLPIDDLKRQLAAIPVNDVPEFAPAIKRLRTAASCRGAFPELTQQKKMDMPLFRAFKTAVVLPPTDAGYAKEQFLQSIRDRARLKSVRNAVKLIRDDYPLLYALEKDWFETLLKINKPRAKKSEDRRFSIELPEISWPAWIIIIVLIRVVMRLFMASD